MVQILSKSQRKKCLKIEKSLEECSKCAWEQSQRILLQARTVIFYCIPQKCNAKLLGVQKQHSKPNTRTRVQIITITAWSIPFSVYPIRISPTYKKQCIRNCRIVMRPMLNWLNETHGNSSFSRHFSSKVTFSAIPAGTIPWVIWG